MSNKEFINVLPDDARWGLHNFTAVVDDINIHFIRNGQGYPVLFLHGWPGFWYDWRRILPVISEEAEVIAPDFRGFGNSDKPDLPAINAYTPDTFANDILTLLKNLQIQQVILVAYDIGATIAQVIARNAPEFVRSLVLMGPSYAGIGLRRYEMPAQREFWYQHFHNLSWSDKLVSYNRDTVHIYLSHFYDYWMSRKEKLYPEEFEAIVDTYSRPGAFKASIQYYRARAASRLRDAMANPAELRIEQPTIVLWGEDDTILSSEWADRLPEFFPNSTVSILPGVGHFVPIESPEEVISAIRHALKTV